MYVYEEFDPLSSLSLSKTTSAVDASSDIGNELTFFVDLINFCVEYINTDDVITLL